MISELWMFFLGIWAWQGLTTCCFIIRNEDETLLCYLAMGLWLVPIGILLTPAKWVREFKRKGGYTWSLLRAPNGEIVRVWPQKNYRYHGVSSMLTNELRNIGYQFITQDDANKLLGDFSESPWSKEVQSGFGSVNVRYSPWVVAKKFPKLVITKEIKEQLDEENRKWDVVKGDEE